MMEKLGIYVQVPFCQTKCTYCNFHTGVVATSRFAPYVEAVCREVRGHRELLRGAGGGCRAVKDGEARSPVSRAAVSPHDSCSMDPPTLTTPQCLRTTLQSASPHTHPLPRSLTLT